MLARTVRPVHSRFGLSPAVYTRFIRILILCTGNICRSPVAEGMLRHRLEGLGVEAKVRSAGLLHSGQPAHTSSIELMGERGIDISRHRSYRLSEAIVRTADLVLGMAREHVREAVVLVPQAFPKAFTLKELVRRGERVGPRREDESVAGWLARAHEGRTSADLLGSDYDDDVADPIGLPRSAYERMAEEMGELLDRLVSLLWAPVLERSTR